MTMLIGTPVGSIVAYGGDLSNRGDIEASGWMLCDGRQLKKDDYPELFAAIGGNFGHYSSHFYLPDLRGRFLRGVSHGSNHDPDADTRTGTHSSNSGDKVGSYQADALKKHTHEAGSQNTGVTSKYDNNSSRVVGCLTENTSEAGDAEESRPKNVNVEWIIKYKNDGVVYTDNAVYTERSDDYVSVQPGSNVRKFNYVEQQFGNLIDLDASSGTIVLEAGYYRVNASSIVSYYKEGDTTTVTTVENPNGGYCLLIEEGAEPTPEHALAVGTISHANMLPSVIESYLLISQQTRVQLIHQAGQEDLEHMYLQIPANDSPWHIFARISISRVM